VVRFIGSRNGRMGPLVLPEGACLDRAAIAGANGWKNSPINDRRGDGSSRSFTLGGGFLLGPAALLGEADLPARCG
jgi:hypothetical protein